MPSKVALLYRGTRDAFTDTRFHDLCDGKGATLVVIKGAKGGVFGGFTSVPWRTGNTYAADPQAFLFALRGHRAQAGKPLKLLPSAKPDQAIYCGTTQSATFGTSSGPGSYDLYLNQQNYCSSCDVGKVYAMVSGRVCRVMVVRLLCFSGAWLWRRRPRGRVDLGGSTTRWLPPNGGGRGVPDRRTTPFPGTCAGCGRVRCGRGGRQVARWGYRCVHRHACACGVPAGRPIARARAPSCT